MARTALFVIDIQSDLAQNLKTEIPSTERIREAGQAILTNARAALERARGNGQKPDLYIVFVQHEEDPEAGTLVRGSKPWELVFNPREDDNAEWLISKNVRDTFESNPQLASRLKAENIETIVAFGIQSERCVLSTSKGALAAGFKVILLKGAHSTYNTNGKQADDIETEVEEQLKREGADIVAWEEWRP
ncbi:Isochorismatase-like protein [Phaeosphaeriaceae sp. PMI808]|nr:Isochorismatase-like protein [Phaeosphaeriaceae sp. PMI808]